MCSLPFWRIKIVSSVLAISCSTVADTCMCSCGRTAGCIWRWPTTGEWTELWGSCLPTDSTTINLIESSSHAETESWVAHHFFHWHQVLFWNEVKDCVTINIKHSLVTSPATRGVSSEISGGKFPAENFRKFIPIFPEISRNYKNFKNKHALDNNSADLCVLTSCIKFRKK